MRRSPFHTFYTPSADDAYLHHRQRRPFPPSSSPPSPAPTPRSVIHIPVHDSASPQSSPLRPVNPPPRPSPAPPAASPPPSLDPASAATTIQSCFRGFSFRRHRPLLHLRSISAARKQLEELNIELESPGFAHKVRASDKERLRFSESVMAIILRLDAIEGSIPEVRSQRKEATKMAIKLQDTIDAIMMQQDEISDPKLRDGVMSDPGLAQECDSKQNEETLYSDVNMMQETAPTMLEGPTSVVDVHIMHEVTPTFLGGPTLLEGDMAGKGCAANSSASATTDLDKNLVIDEGLLCLPLLEPEDACSPRVTDSSESRPQDASAEEMDAAEHDMKCTCVEDAVSEVTRAFGGDANSGIDSGCGAAHSGIAQGNVLVPKVDEGIFVDDAEVAHYASVTNAVADLSSTLMDVGQEANECFYQGGKLCPGTPIAEDKLDRNDAPKLASDQLCPDFIPRDHVKYEHQDASTLEDSLLERLTGSNCSSEGADTATLCSYENIKDEEKLQPSTLSTMGTSLSSDSILLQQLSEDCRQLKSLLGNVLAHSKAQSKVICALGDRLEMLEHQQQLNCQRSSRRTCEKRKLKKGSKRCVKLPRN